MMTSYQQRLFDGFAVARERATIGKWDIEAPDIEHYRADEVLVMVVTATVAGGSYAHDNNGDWIRTNKLVAHQCRVATGVMKDEIVEFYNLAGDELPFPKRSHSASPAGTPSGSPGQTSGPGTSATPAASTGVQAGSGTSNSTTSSGSGGPSAPLTSSNVSSGSTTTPSSASSASRDPALAAFLDDPDAGKQSA